MGVSSQVANLLARGVRCVAPETVTVGPEVVAERVAAGTTIHPGCRLTGASLAIGPDCVLGEEGPVTVRDCQLGARVRLRGGFFERAAMLDDIDAGSCAHVRPGTLLEEHVSFGHSVGLKQTVLLPHMTLGSLINFCDCLMAGGTGEENHSEVGSSYVHFNFTPHQEKATPSLIGDVPRGVMLDQAPIFLGGQGGLVGPCRIAYGTVLAAGQVCRRDQLVPGRLVFSAAPAAAAGQPYDPRLMGAIGRRVVNNLHYLGNLLALDAWWRVVRAPFAAEPWQVWVHAGACARLQEMFDERIKRLDQFAQRVAASAARAAALGLDVNGEPFDRQRAFVAAWPALGTALRARIAARMSATPPAEVSAIVAHLANRAGREYLDWVRGLSAADKAALSAWLQGDVDACLALFSQ